MLVLEKIGIKRDLSTPVAISLLLLAFLSIFILTRQIKIWQGVQFERAAGNLTLMQQRSLPEGKVISHTISPSAMDFKTFREVLAYRESGGKYGKINKFGYLGKYQFGKSTLNVLGIKSTDEFIENPTLQEKAFILNVARNKWILRKEILYFNGRRINGIEITESGIIAAAHLSGPGNVKKYLRSRGGNNVKDAYGTSLENYMRNFGGFNISSVPAVRRPRL